MSLKKENKYSHTYLLYRVLNDTTFGKLLFYEVGRGAAARGVTAKPTGCRFDPHSRR